MKKIVKRLIVTVLLAAILIVITGCGSEKESPEPEDGYALIPSPANDGNWNKEYTDTYFEDYGTNNDTEVSEDSKSTFALDVDTASYTPR